MARRSTDWYTHYILELLAGASQSQVVIMIPSDYHMMTIKMKKPSESLIQLMHKMEYLIGSETFNGNIQNFGSWGEWESEGRKFRYPVRYTDKDGEIRKYSAVLPLKKVLEKNVDEFSCDFVPLTADEMLTAHYAFGANQLYVFKGILKALRALEDDLGIDLEEMLNYRHNQSKRNDDTAASSQSRTDPRHFHAEGWNHKRSYCYVISTAFSL